MFTLELITSLVVQAVVITIMVIAVHGYRTKLGRARDREYADICELVHLRLQVDKYRKLAGLRPEPVSAEVSAEVSAAIADVADVEIGRRPLPRAIARPRR